MGKADQGGRTAILYAPISTLEQTNEKAKVVMMAFVGWSMLFILNEIWLDDN